MTAKIIYLADWRRLHPAARIAFDPFWAARLWLAFWFPKGNRDA